MQTSYTEGLYVKILFSVALLIYIYTAYNSHGYYHADEHYQIIEFSGSKLGTHSIKDLPWEYKERIRSAIQPTINVFAFRALHSINIINPYHQAFALRLLTCLTALLIFYYFITQTINLFKSHKTKLTYCFVFLFLWFIPFLSVRYSSETWSGLLFLLALSAIFHIKKSHYKPLLIGFILGLSFLFRFQISFAVIGLSAWLLFVQKESLVYFMKFGAGFLFAVGIGTLIDCWFYEEFVFTPWNYLFFSTLKESPLEFGNAPWYYYFVSIYNLPSPFLGILILFSLLIVLFKNPNNIFLWCILPFILIHSIIPHKEARFLFPIAFLFPIILIIAYDTLTKWLLGKTMLKIIKYYFFILLITINAVGLIAMGTKAAGTGRMAVTKHLHDNYKGQSVHLIHSTWANPYNPWQSLPAKFYSKNNVSEKSLKNIHELSDTLIMPNSINFLILKKEEFNNPKTINYIEKNNFVFEMQSVPGWIESLQNYYSGFDKNKILVLYKYNSK